MLDAQRALREMALDRILIDGRLREKVYRVLLLEARIDEARELDATLIKGSRWASIGEGVFILLKLIGKRETIAFIHVLRITMKVN